MKEVQSYEGDLDDHEIQAVRLGGGSATVMKPDLLGKLLNQVRHTLPVAKGAEVSFDALPNTIGTPSLTGIASGHPTRAEVMMRSENDDELKALNCAFTMQDTRNAMLFLHRFHLNNISLTVNYGIPGQTAATWQNTVRSCTIMRPEHIHIEPLAVTDAEGMPDEGTRFGMYDSACRYLSEQGYIQYTAGDFCRPYHENRFEMLRMNGTACLGMGVNAQSVFDGYVTRNTDNVGLYVKNAGDFEKLITRVYQADEEYLMNNYFYGRLHLVRGFSETEFEDRFQKPLPENLRKELDERIEKGWLEETDGRYIPTRKGFFHVLDRAGYTNSNMILKSSD